MSDNSFPWKNISHLKALSREAFFTWKEALGKKLTTDSLRKR